MNSNCSALYLFFKSYSPHTRRILSLETRARLSTSEKIPSIACKSKRDKNNSGSSTLSLLCVHERERQKKKLVSPGAQETCKGRRVEKKQGAPVKSSPPAITRSLSPTYNTRSRPLVLSLARNDPQQQQQQQLRIYQYIPPRLSLFAPTNVSAIFSRVDILFFRVASRHVTWPRPYSDVCIYIYTR